MISESSESEPFLRLSIEEDRAKTPEEEKSQDK